MKKKVTQYLHKLDLPRSQIESKLSGNVLFWATLAGKVGKTFFFLLGTVPRDSGEGCLYPLSGSTIGNYSRESLRRL